MTTKEDFVNHAYQGRETEYKPKEHIGLLYEVLNVGKDIATFCKRAMIDKTTFHRWKNRYPEFKYAYDIAINFAEDVWMSYPDDNPDFNYQRWYLIMRNRFGFGKGKIDLKDKKKAVEVIDAVLDSLSQGEISTNEAKHMADLAVSKSNIEVNNPPEKERLSKAELQKRGEIFLKMNNYKIMYDELKEAKKQNEELKKQLAVENNTQQANNSTPKPNKHKKKKRKL